MDTTPARRKKTMNAIILKGRDYDNLQEIDSRSQTQTQYGNIRVALYRVTANIAKAKAGDLLLIEEDADNREYLLDTDEAQTALADTDAYLRDAADAWADSMPDPQMERYQWGIADPANDVVSADDTRPCRIVVKGCYYGYTPYDYATDERGETLIFDNAAAAQAWIDEQEAGRYDLGHNEAGRPTSYIVAA